MVSSKIFIPKHNGKVQKSSLKLRPVLLIFRILSRTLCIFPSRIEVNQAIQHHHRGDQATPQDTRRIIWPKSDARNSVGGSASMYNAYYYAATLPQNQSPKPNRHRGKEGNLKFREDEETFAWSFTSRGVTKCRDCNVWTAFTFYQRIFLIFFRQQNFFAAFQALIPPICCQTLWAIHGSCMLCIERREEEECYRFQQPARRKLEGCQIPKQILA